MVWNLFFSKVILILGKARSHKTPNLGCKRAESPGWFDISPKSRSDACEWVHFCGEATNYQLPIGTAFRIIQIVSMEECSSLMQNLIQIHCCTHSVILNVTATQYTCSFSEIYHPPPVTSTVKSSLFTHAHSSPLSLAARLHHSYVNNSRFINNCWTC